MTNTENIKSSSRVILFLSMNRCAYAVSYTHLDVYKRQNLFLYSRADTIYGGTNQIQRNLIAERGLGMPREPRGTA